MFLRAGPPSHLGVTYLAEFNGCVKHDNMGGNLSNRQLNVPARRPPSEWWRTHINFNMINFNMIFPVQNKRLVLYITQQFYGALAGISGLLQAFAYCIFIYGRYI